MEEKLRLAALFLYLLIAAGMDVKTRRVSTKLAAAAGTAAVLAELAWRPLSAACWLAGALPGVFLLLAGRITEEAIGYGDGAAVLVCGSFLGFWGCLEVTLWGLLLTAPVSLSLIVLKKAGRKTRLPFLPFLLAGYAIWLQKG